MFSSVSSQLSSVLFLEIRNCISTFVYSQIRTKRVVGQRENVARLFNLKDCLCLCWSGCAATSWQASQNGMPITASMDGQILQPRPLAPPISSYTSGTRGRAASFIYLCLLCGSGHVKLLSLHFMRKKNSLTWKKCLVTARTYYVLYTQGKCLCIK